MKLLIIVFLISITGCGYERKLRQITCDSGYKTPVSYSAHINDGIISFARNKNDYYSDRKMLEGEICTLIVYKETSK